MPDWGYKINIDNQIDFEKIDDRLFQEVLALEPSFGTCISCGSCAGTCSAGDFTTFSLRKINILLSRGEREIVFKEITKCMLCGKCSLVCPRGINIRNAILSIRKVLN